MKPDILNMAWNNLEKLIAGRGKGRYREFELGDHVLARQEVIKIVWMRGKVARRTGPVSYEV